MVAITRLGLYGGPRGHRTVAPVVSGGYTATMAVSASPSAAMEAKVNRKATVVHTSSVTADLRAVAHRKATLSAGAEQSVINYADVVRTGPMQVDVGVTTSMSGVVNRTATLAASTGQTTSITGNVIMPSWTLNGIDSTHHVTDGPRINAALLDYGDAIDPSDIGEAGRFGDSGASTYMNAFLTRTIGATDLVYVEWELISSANIAQSACGVANSSYNKSSTLQIGDTANVIAARITGHVRENSVTLQDHSASVPYANGDQWALAFDANTGKIWYRYNGTWLNGGDPAAGTGEDGTLTGSGFEVCCTVNGNGEIRWNFGQRDWEYSPPAGFLGLGDFD